MATSGNVVSTNMIAETPFNRAVPDTLVNGSFSGKPEDSDIGLSRNLMEEREAKDDLRWYLMNKYRSILVDRLTAEDLEELRTCQRRWSDAKNKQDRQKDFQAAVSHFFAALSVFTPFSSCAM